MIADIDIFLFLGRSFGFADRVSYERSVVDTNEWMHAYRMDFKTFRYGLICLTYASIYNCLDICIVILRFPYCSNLPSLERCRIPKCQTREPHHTSHNPQSPTNKPPHLTTLILSLPAAVGKPLVVSRSSNGLPLLSLVAPNTRLISLQALK